MYGIPEMTQSLSAFIQYIKLRALSSLSCAYDVRHKFGDVCHNRDKRIQDCNVWIPHDIEEELGFCIVRHMHYSSTFDLLYCVINS